MTQHPNVDQTLENPPKKPKTPLTRTEKIRDLSIGFIGWWLVNGLVWFVFNLDAVKYGGELVTIGLLLFSLVYAIAQLITLIVLAFRRGWIALGALSAMGLNLVISLMLGLLINSVCFAPFFIPME